MIEPLDSYYSYIAARMAAIDSTQKMCGVVAARDWPLTPPIEGGLYLLFLSAVPTTGTESQIFYEYSCQWNWLLIGTDISPTQQAENRGDRYRKSMQIVKNLRQANFPSFCSKKSFAANAQGTVTQMVYDPIESIWWSHLRMMPRADNDKSGLVYGAAALQLFAYDDVLATASESASF